MVIKIFYNKNNLQLKCLNNNISTIENHRRPYAENYFDADKTALQLIDIYKDALEKRVK